jgi:hypothetical protein
MKEIEPIDVWQNGTTKTAVKLQAQGTSVTLGHSSLFLLATADRRRLSSSKR